MLSNLSTVRLPKIALPRFSKKAPALIAKWVSLIFVFLMAWTLGSLAWYWVSPYQGKITNATYDKSASSSVNSLPYQLSQITNSNLFGLYDQSAPNAGALPVVEAPITNLNLTLVGVVYATSPSKGLAIISNGAQQTIYAVDETIEGTGVVLKQVLPDRVIFSNRQRNETLMLDGVEYEKIDRLGQSIEPQKVAKAPTASNPNLAKIKQEIMQNPQSLLKYITLSQVREQGKVVGYRLGPGSDAHFFNESGIKSGDVAVAINNVDLTDPAKMSEIWKTLSDSSEINMTVKRQGQLHKIYISL